MRARRVLIAVLFVAGCARQITAVGHSGYTPQWHVGDWWTVKSWEMETHRGGWQWIYRRYDVARIEKVGKHDCYVLEIRGSRHPNICRTGDAYLVYVRTDNWRVIRTVAGDFFSNKRVSSIVRDYPLGLFGPFVSEPRLPRFPLRVGDPDTTFKRERRDDCYLDLREIPRPADSVLVRGLLAEGDTAGSRVIRPAGTVYAVRSELGGDFVPGSHTERENFTQSFQLWSDDQPWRLYEAVADFEGPKYEGRLQERSWLIAVGKGGK